MPIEITRGARWGVRSFVLIGWALILFPLTAEAIFVLPCVRCHLGLALLVLLGFYLAVVRSSSLPRIWRALMMILVLIVGTGALYGLRELSLHRDLMRNGAYVIGTVTNRRAGTAYISDSGHRVFVTWPLQNPDNGTWEEQDGLLPGDPVIVFESQLHRRNFKLFRMDGEPMSPVFTGELDPAVVLRLARLWNVGRRSRDSL